MELVQKAVASGLPVWVCGVNRPAHAAALLDLGVRADVIPVGASFDGYEVLIAPMLHVMPDDLRARLTSYTDAGGHLVTTYFSGIVDQNDRVWLGGYPGALRELLGVMVEEFVPLLPGERVAVDG